MSEKLQFISRLLDGERMSDLCREFGISRKTGHKYSKRYNEEGLDGLKERSRKAKNLPHKVSSIIESYVLEIKSNYKTWGAPKIREKLYQSYNVKNPPATSTIHSILSRHDLVKKKRRKKQSYKAEGTILTVPDQANELWCADFKGQFRMKNGRYCYPLTITDDFSRYFDLM